jgi:hypothetical protein
VIPNNPARIAPASSVERLSAPAWQENGCFAKDLAHIGGNLAAGERRGAESKPPPRRAGRGRAADTGAGGSTGPTRKLPATRELRNTSVLIAFSFGKQEGVQRCAQSML